MNKAFYQKIVNKYKPKENKLNNLIISFVSGGCIGLICEIISSFLLKIFNIDLTTSYSITTLILILATSICTGLGFFDNLVQKFKCGLIIPTTGFAHSVTSSSMEYKKDGFITGVGTNFFKLAGSVIVYGICFSFLLVLIKVVMIIA